MPELDATRAAQIETALKVLVIAYDADLDEEFIEALVTARELLGFKLVDGEPTEPGYGHGV